MGSVLVLNRPKQEADLANRAQGALGKKLPIADRLREAPLVTVKWVAARLRMATAGHVNDRLYGGARERWREMAGVNNTKNCPRSEKRNCGSPSEFHRLRPASAP